MSRRRLAQQQFEEFRDEALQLALLQNKMARWKNTAYEAGGAFIAQHLYLAAEIRRQLEAANEKAASEIFNYLNEHLPEDEIDLHGLYVKEAINLLSAKLRSARSSGFIELKVIVGRGLHSNGGPKIKPAVINFCEQEKIEHFISQSNPGCICLYLKTQGYSQRVTYSSTIPKLTTEIDTTDLREATPKPPSPSKPTIEIGVTRPHPRPARIADTHPKTTIPSSDDLIIISQSTNIERDNSSSCYGFLITLSAVGLSLWLAQSTWNFF